METFLFLQLSVLNNKNNIMKYCIYLLLTLLIIINIQCKKDNKLMCFNMALAGAINVMGPTTIAVNSTAVFSVTYALNNGCESFSSKTETKVGNTITIGLQKAISGCVCTQIYSEPAYNYIFNPNNNTGVYTLKFIKADGTFIEKQITVN